MVEVFVPDAELSRGRRAAPGTLLIARRAGPGRRLGAGRSTGWPPRSVGSARSLASAARRARRRRPGRTGPADRARASWPRPGTRSTGWPTGWSPAAHQRAGAGRRPVAPAAHAADRAAAGRRGAATRRHAAIGERSARRAGPAPRRSGASGRRSSTARGRDRRADQHHPQGGRRTRRRPSTSCATPARWSGTGWCSGPRWPATRTGRTGWSARTPRIPVPVPAAELAAALDAVLGNVFRYTPQGTAFEVAVSRRDGYVAVRVDDAGPGIADPDRALRRGASDQGSTGLGLDIARRVALAGQRLGQHRPGPAGRGQRGDAARDAEAAPRQASRFGLVGRLAREPGARRWPRPAPRGRPDARDDRASIAPTERITSRSPQVFLRFWLRTVHLAGRSWLTSPSIPSGSPDHGPQFVPHTPVRRDPRAAGRGRPHSTGPAARHHSSTRSAGCLARPATVTRARRRAPRRDRPFARWYPAHVAPSRDSRSRVAVTGRCR